MRWPRVRDLTMHSWRLATQAGSRANSRMRCSPTRGSTFLQRPRLYSILRSRSAGIPQLVPWASISPPCPRKPGTPDLSRPRTILAFDFGLRRIGVAVGQDVTGSASPLGVVENRDSGVDHQQLAALIKEWRPTNLVVGMPAHADGSPSEIQQHVEDFIGELERYGLPISTVDERYTSVEAQRVLKEARAAGTRGRISKEMIDSAAAVFIAERYLLSE